MALTSGKNGRAHVLEVSNRAAVQVLNNTSLTEVANDLSSHKSSGNTNAHQISNINGLQTALNGKETAFSKNTAFNKNFGTAAGTVCQGNDSRLSDARTPLPHTHSISNVTGLQTALDDKQNVLTGFTGSFSVVTAVNFAGSSVTTKTITVSNGVIVSVV